MLDQPALTTRARYYLAPWILVLVAACAAAPGPAVESNDRSEDPEAESLAMARLIQGPLSVSNGHIMDVGNQNQWVRMSSAGYAGMAEPFSGTWLKPDEAAGEGATETLYAAHRRLGFNTVRLLVSWTDMEPDAPWVAVPGTYKADADDARYWNADYEQDLKDVVRKYTEAGVAVILGFHPYNREQFWDGSPKNSAFPWWFYQKLGADSPRFTGDKDKTVLNCAFLSNDPGGSSDFYQMNSKFTERHPYSHLAEYLKRLAKIVPRDEGFNVVGIDLWNEPYVDNACRKAHPGFRRNFIVAMGNAIGSVRDEPFLIISEEVWRGDIRNNTWEMSGSGPTFNNPKMKFVWSFHFYPNYYTGDALTQLQNAAAHASDLDNAPIYIGESDPRVCGSDATLGFTGYTFGKDWPYEDDPHYYHLYITSNALPNSFAFMNEPAHHISLGVTRLTGSMHSMLKKTGADFSDCASNENNIDPNHVPDSPWLAQVATTFTH